MIHQTTYRKQYGSCKAKLNERNPHDDLRQYHLQETQRLLAGNARQFLEHRIAPKFRELHCLFVELEEGKRVTPQVEDEVLSYGERLSSEIVATAFEGAGIKAWAH